MSARGATTQPSAQRERRQAPLGHIPRLTTYHQRPIGLTRSRVDGLTAAQHDPAQPNRMTTSARPADLLKPALALGITRPRDKAADGRSVQLVDGRGGHRRGSKAAVPASVRTAHTPRTPASRLLPTPASASRRNRSGIGHGMRAFSSADACWRGQVARARSCLVMKRFSVRVRRRAWPPLQVKRRLISQPPHPSARTFRAHQVHARL